MKKQKKVEGSIHEEAGKTSLTKDDVSNILYFLSQCPANGLTQAEVLVDLCSKLQALISGDK